jgi:DNA-binding transcriptional MerR regulator
MLNAAAAPARSVSTHGLYTITDLVGEFHITPRTLRFYEDEGLLKPLRRGQMRLYSKADHARLAWVLRGKRVGFSLAEIRELLDLYGADSSRTTQRVKTLEKCQERIAALERQRNDLDQMIDELQDFCATLSSMVAPNTKKPKAGDQHA